MWHEARRHEKKIRGMMVDYQKRSERRRLYYQKIKADPAQFLRVTGTKYKIYVDEEAIAIHNTTSSLMPWQGQKDNLIDRFDVRAHLDMIPEVNTVTTLSDPLATDENAVINQKCHYERWRTLATNDLVGLSEADCLAQIKADEVFVPAAEQRRKAKPKAQIAFNYDKAESESESDDENDLLTTEPDVDVTFDVRELEPEHKEKLNSIAANRYNIPDFTRLHIEDKVESENREFEFKAEQSRMERVSKLSKHERRKEKEERRRNKEIPSYMKVDDPHRNVPTETSPDRRRRGRRGRRGRSHDRRRSRDSSSSSSSSEGEGRDVVVQNIEISSVRSRTYRNVKRDDGMMGGKIQPLLFLQKPAAAASSDLMSLAAKRRALLTADEDTLEFGPEEDREGVAFGAGKPDEAPSADGEGVKDQITRSRSRSSSPVVPRRRRYRSYRSRSQSRDPPGAVATHDGRSRSRERNSHTKCKTTPVTSGPASLKQLKPHERLKMKLQSQLKKQVRNEKKREMMAEEQKEQQELERKEELRILKRKMWEKEEEEYWKRREERRKEGDDGEGGSGDDREGGNEMRGDNRGGGDEGYSSSRKRAPPRDGPRRRRDDDSRSLVPDYHGYENSYEERQGGRSSLREDDRHRKRGSSRRSPPPSSSTSRGYRDYEGAYDHKRSHDGRNDHYRRSDDGYGDYHGRSDYRRSGDAYENRRSGDAYENRRSDSRYNRDYRY